MKERGHFHRNALLTLSRYLLDQSTKAFFFLGLLCGGVKWVCLLICSVISARGVSYSTPRRKGKTEIEYKGEICPCNFVFIFRLQIFVLSSSLYNYYGTGPSTMLFGSQYRASEVTRFLLFYWRAWACCPILPPTGLQLARLAKCCIAMVMKKKKKKKRPIEIKIEL